MPVTVNGLVALRTHIWDTKIAEVSRRTFNMSSELDFVVLADESNGSIDPGYEKISHTDDFAAFPLPNLPAKRRLWYNADYALYALRKAKPQYDWYVVLEYDVVITENILHILEQVQNRKIDFVSHEIREAQKEWCWYRTSEKFDDAPWRAFSPFMIISGRAIDHLLQTRYDFFEKIQGQSNVQLPFCELFIPTALRSLPDYQYAELSDFVELVHYDWKHPVDLADPICERPHTVIHPVLSQQRLIMKMISVYGIASFFDPNSLATHRLRFTDPRLIDMFIRAYLAQAHLTARQANKNYAYKLYDGIE